MARGCSDVVHYLVQLYVRSVDLPPREPRGVLVPRTSELVPSSAEGDVSSGTLACSKTGHGVPALCFALTGMVVPMLGSVVVGNTGPVRRW